jgi:transcriptional regulator with XRE-family HTH domain
MSAMSIALELIRARRAAGFSQRALAERAAMPQSTVGRIEAGLMDPRLRTLDRLLRACDAELEVVPRLGHGVDRSQMRERLRLTPRERLEQLAAASNAMSRIRGAARRTRR